jgi:hypothetical protein
MNVKIAIIAGLVMVCTPALRAQDDPQNGPYIYDAIIPAVPAMYAGADSTNGVIFLMPVDQSYSAWTEVSSNVDGIEHPAMSSEYPLLFLFQEEAMVFTDSEWEESGVIQTAEIEMTFPDHAAGSEPLYWLTESVSQKNETVAGAGNSNRVQVIFIEPLNAPGIDVSDDILIPEYKYKIVYPQPAWYEWVNPRLFLTQWADFWANETNATPVVLVLFTF